MTALDHLRSAVEHHDKVLHATRHQWTREARDREDLARRGVVDAARALLGRHADPAVWSDLPEGHR